MKKRIISLHGSYFGNNYGDILLINIFAKWIKQCCEDCSINLPKANKKVTFGLPDGTTGISNLIKSKALVFCGGGYFGEQPQHPQKWAIRNFFRHATVALIARFFRIPYAIIGVEFGPISSKWFRSICISIAKHAKIVVVRNKESYDFIKRYDRNINVIISADAVLSLSEIVKPIETYTKEKKKILIHFNGRNNLPENYEYVIETIITSVKKCFNNFEIVFLSDCEGNYYENEICKRIFRKLQDESIPFTQFEYNGCDSLINEINCSYCIFTSKLHVGITAAALNKKVFSLWFHNKTPRLHAQINNTDNCIAFNLACNGFESKVEKFLKSTEYTLPSKVKDTALTNKTELFNFLKTYVY